MNNKFSWSRFGRFARAELVGERRAWLLKLGSFLALCMVVYLLWNINEVFGQSDENPFNEIHVDFSLNRFMSRFFVLIVLFFLIAYNLSCGFKRYFSKDRAAAIMMLPVTKGEKFLYVALMNLILIPAVLIVLALLNDLLWALLLGFDNVFGLLNWVTEGFSETQLQLFWRQITIYAASTFTSMTFFLAGAIVFRRHQFLWTLLISFIVSIPVASLLQYFLYNDPEFVGSIIDWLTSSNGLYFELLWCVLWACLWIFVAWRRFSTLQISK
ncbi:hypothetical protein [Millionella massiliensis]|uniref:hypothetical protein n=1 Tax=Millionella massiliensis TaxID=1871023 RepID=UPI0023A90BB8|nr:hypothetical protein [Millionella massiliensis]